MKQEARVFSPEVFNTDGDWKDYFLELKNVKKGDTFYESSNRKAVNYELKALEDAHKYKNWWICKVQKMDGNVIELCVSASTGNPSYPLPNFFTTPQVLSFIDGLGHVYEVC